MSWHIITAEDSRKWRKLSLYFAYDIIVIWIFLRVILVQGGWVGLGLCCLMTPGLSKDIQCHVWPYFFPNLHITRSDIRPHIKWAVSLVIAYGHGHINISWGLCGYVRVNILTLSPLRREQYREESLHVIRNPSKSCKELCKLTGNCMLYISESHLIAWCISQWNGTASYNILLLTQFREMLWTRTPLNWREVEGCESHEWKELHTRTRPNSSITHQK